MKKLLAITTGRYYRMVMAVKKELQLTNS